MRVRAASWLCWSSRYARVNPAAHFLAMALDEELLKLLAAATPWARKQALNVANIRLKFGPVDARAALPGTDVEALA
jgi:hypothetical protein